MPTVPYDKGDSSGSVPALTSSGGTSYPAGAVVHGTEGGTVTVVSTTSGLPVQPQTSSTWAVTQSGSWTVGVSGSVAVTGTFWQATQPVSIASTVTVTGAGGTFPVTDSGGSLTVDAPVGTPVFVRLSDGSAAITTLPVSIASTVTVTGTGGTFPVTDSGGSLTVDDGGTTLSVDDGGGSLTVDGTVAVSGTVTVDSELTTANLDVGFGTDTRAVVGLVYGGYGGGTVVSTTNPLPVGDNGGSLTVDDGGGSLTVDNAGTFRVQGCFDVDGVTNGPAAGTVYSGFGGSAVVQWANLRTAAGAEVATATTTPGGSDRGLVTRVAGTAAVSLASVPSHDVTNAGTFAVQVSSALPAGTNAIGKLAANSGVDIGDVDVTSVPADPFGANADAASATGSISAKLRFIASNGIPITGTVTVGSHAVTNAGTFAVQVDGTALTRLTDIETNTDSGAVVGNGAAAAAQRVTIADDSTGVLATVSTVTTVSTLTTLANGQTAHDAAATGSPLRVGAKAETALSGVTLVADGDATDLHAGVDGVLIVRPHCNLEDIVSGVAAITDGSSTSVIAAQGSGVKVYVTSVVIANTSATAVTVDLRDGTGGSVKATYPVPANTAGVVHSLPVPLPFSADTAVAADPSAAASTVTVTLAGFRSKV